MEDPGTASKPVRLTTPLTDEAVVQLEAGEKVLIRGILYTARDAAHKRMIEALERGEDLPFDPRGQILYYVGPTPAPPGRPIGAAGPTTSSRMDPYTPALYERGLKATLGKGARSSAVIEAMRKHKGIYLAATGGAAALLARCVVKAEVVAYEDLGPEAIRRIEVVDLPAIVVNDTRGGDLYAAGQARFRRPARP